MSETWTIGELAGRAADALRPHAQGANGRVREVPGERLIRWYTTIGLVDPPLTRRGRVARYGRRHLLQIVAVKRLQSRGHSIADIQARLTGATDAMLETAAALNGSPATAEPVTPRARPAFWTQRPAEPGADPSTGPSTGPGTGVWVRVGDGVTLMLEGASRTPTDDDIEAIRAAAGPLVQALQERNLT
ncbi:helix-turn-helix domain-containing protein [Nonomuraea sp. NBC_01738]|uniref:helix-turn-helix domain-containing protein n=1 Tax=Nonomuraea sp. NBC_01738 TaxID=2976003 RepID=UPI002E0FA374|nr:helix-turn-helix domain-containing protein [Nonomuraea sp. NBC_01738]